MSLTPSDYTALTEILDRALRSPAGLLIKTEDPDALRRRFYIAMRLAREDGSERFNALLLRVGHSSNILEIHKRSEAKGPLPGRPPGTPNQSPPKELD